MFSMFKTFFEELRSFEKRMEELRDKQEKILDVLENYYAKEPIEDYNPAEDSFSTPGTQPATKNTDMALKVLIVDDEEGILKLYTEVLKEEDDVKIDTSSNVRSALRMIDTHSYDVVITDLGVSDGGMGSGIHVAKAAKESGAFVVVSTGAVATAGSIYNMVPEADEILRKPCPEECFKRLIGFIRASLNRKEVI